MNNYLLESNDYVLLEKEQNEVIKKNGFENIQINTYDLEDTNLENAIEDLDTYSLFSDKKIIIIKNIEKLKVEENKKSIEHLLKYLDNPKETNLLIIEANKLNNTTKLAKDLKKKCIHNEIKFNSKEYIKNEFKDYKIDTKTIDYLNELCLEDLTKIKNECLKLKNYKMNDKIITKTDIDEIVTKKLGDSKELTFAFTKALAMKDKKDALIKYHELLEYNIEPISIIALLASQIRIIYQVKILENEHLTTKKISEKLGNINEYRIKKTQELTKLYSEKELLELMQKIFEIDLKMKTTDQDKFTLIELFILNI